MAVRKLQTTIEVRLMDFDAPEAREADGSAAEETLARLALNQPVECVVMRGCSRN